MPAPARPVRPPLPVASAATTPAPRPRPRRRTALLLAGAALALALAGCSSSPAPAPPTSALVLQPQTALSPTQLAVAARTLQQRLAALHVSADVTARNGHLQVTAPTDAADAVRRVAGAGVLEARAVVLCRALPPAPSGSTPATVPVPCAAPLHPDTGTAPSYPAILANGAAAPGATTAVPDAVYQRYRTATGCPASAVGTDRAADQPESACDQAATTLFLLAPASVRGVDVVTATATADPATGGWQVTVHVVSAAAKSLNSATTALAPVGTQLAVTLDGQVLAAAPVTAADEDGTVTVTGLPDEATAAALVAELSTGALPTSFTVSASASASPTTA